MDQSGNIPHYGTAQEAFLATIKALLSGGNWVEPTTDPTSIGSRFGTSLRRTKEIICAGFAIDNPRARLIDCPSRRIDLVFAFANFIWTLAGNDDVASIAAYNSKGVAFSGDGKHFAGALGYRMQKTAHGSQLHAVIKILKEDPASRRAVLQFYSESDSILRPKDTPCVIALHFLIREQKLFAITQMRSQSALMVMPYDLILYTMIHELVASELNIELGVYFHICNSFHFYEDEVQIAEKVIAEPFEPSPIAMDVMPKNSLHSIDTVCSIERANRERGPEFAIKDASNLLPPYWHDIIRVLAIGMLAKKTKTKSTTDMSKIHTAYKRWFQ